MRQKRTKDYWVQRKERFADGRKAQERAGALRMHEHVSHVKVDQAGDGFEVSYAVARWYLENLAGAGIQL